MGIDRYCCCGEGYRPYHVLPHRELYHLHSKLEYRKLDNWGWDWDSGSDDAKDGVRLVGRCSGSGSKV